MKWRITPLKVRHYDSEHRLKLFAIRRGRCYHDVLEGTEFIFAFCYMKMTDQCFKRSRRTEKNSIAI